MRRIVAIALCAVLACTVLISCRTATSVNSEEYNKVVGESSRFKNYITNFIDKLAQPDEKDASSTSTSIKTIEIAKHSKIQYDGNNSFSLILTSTPEGIHAFATFKFDGSNDLKSDYRRVASYLALMKVDYTPKSNIAVIIYPDSNIGKFIYEDGVLDADHSSYPKNLGDTILSTKSIPESDEFKQMEADLDNIFGNIDE